MEEINYLLIASAALVTIASPGPATLAIMAVSMNQGRFYSAMMALGILTGSLFWSVSAAFGLGAIMQANAWLFEMIRIIGALYLLYLSYRSIRSALKSVELNTNEADTFSATGAYRRGLLIHLTNPKAILFFGALYSIAIPDGTTVGGLVSVILFVGMISTGIFFSYALIFSSATASRLYLRSKRAFEAAFGVLFGLAGLNDYRLFAFLYYDLLSYFHSRHTHNLHHFL